jgi:hypothetical protein
MPLTRLDNLISSKTGRYLYVSPDDFNASDALDNRGNSPTRPFLTIQRAFLEVGRYSYTPKGVENNPDNDRFDEFTILLAPGNHYIDNRPGEVSASSVPVFNYINGDWSDSSILDISNPNNILYKFNSVEGGAIIPRGTSLVGTDLRRTQVRPLYVPDPADKDVARTSIFQVTGGCYFWQFTILDGDLSKNSPLYDGVIKTGKVYSQPNLTTTSIPLYSHHKITNFIFARKQDLGLLYQKIARAFSAYQPEIDDPGEFAPRVQENRIVGPLTDSNQIENIVVNNVTIGTNSYTKITITTKVDHLFFVNQAVAVTNVGANEKLNGVFYVSEISTTSNKEFSYLVDGTAAGLGLVNGQPVDPAIINKTGTLASVQAEVDSVESASPYIFNVSIRSTWGICGIWADGSRASGFKSMVIAQYTGVSLQKDDRAFIRYDEFTNTWNQANLQDAFSTTPYHIDGTAFWKDDWRNFHVRASDDSFIQCVSIFAVGFADHFLMESGGDMSITNSNSNFGNTSLHTKGYKGFSFNQDKGGYISDIIPPKKIDSTNTTDVFYYPFNLKLTREVANNYRIYLNPPDANFPDKRPASSISGNKIGAKPGEIINVKLDAVGNEVGKQLKNSIIYPNGVKKWTSTLTTLSPAASGIDNLAQDAANLIDANKEFIQEEAFGYILQKYPDLQNRPYVNPNITNETGRYRDASNLIKLNRQEIIDTAFADMVAQYPSSTIPGNTQAGNQVGGDGTIKCKRDIGYIVDAVANDLYSGGNSNIVDATKAYFDGAGVPISNGLVGETVQSAFAFGKARDYMKQALTNNLSIKDLTVIADTATNSNIDSSSCANVQSTVDTLISIINTSITDANLSSLPSRNVGPWSVVSENSKCKRDIGYIVEAITSDLRLGGNQNVVNAAQAYYTGTALDYIENEKTESLDAYQYVRDLAVAAMRNWSFVRQACVTTTDSGNTIISGVVYPTASIVNVGSTLGINVGMKVTGTGIPSSGAYVKTIISPTQIELGAQYSRLRNGNSVNAASAQSNTTLTFTLTEGAWATSSVPLVDPSIITTNAGYPECASVANAIDTYYQIIYTIINTPNGINSVTINVPSIVNTTELAKRATLFKLNEIGTAQNANPHKLETGTPVKLVPRATNNSVDKRLVRLPKEFDTNTKYYVIAPGRFTQPYDYSEGVTASFNGNDAQVIMLAASEENANAGIYIYSPETNSVAPGVTIEIHQYVKDINYDLIKYKTNLVSNSTTTFETEGPHGFDKPLSSTTDTEDWSPQKVFFRTGADISGSALPQKNSGGVLSDSTEYYVRYIKPTVGTLESKYNTRFTIHTSLIGAKNGTGAVEFTPSNSSNPSKFYVYSNKRRSPLKFDPELTPKPIPVSIISIQRTQNIVNGNVVNGINYIKCGNTVGGVTILAKHGLAANDSVIVDCSDDTFDAPNSVVVANVIDDYTFSYVTTQTAVVGSGTFISAGGTITKVTSVSSATQGGCWYLQCDPSNNAIYDRTILIPTKTSSDTYFTRVEDDRAISDKIYRLRYVIPKDGNYRDPINGFVLKIRTDDTRKLLPQKIVLKPFNTLAQSIPTILYGTERIGLTTTELKAADPSFVSTSYDPYKNPLVFTTDKDISFTIQSAKKIKQIDKEYLELTIFDIGISKTSPYKNDIFTTVKVSEPQGGNNGNFTVNSTITWSGYSSGSATVHAWFQDTNYLILRNATAAVEFSAFTDTIFSQGTGTSTRTAVMLEKPDSGKSDKTQFLYTTDGAGVYTMTPGDTIILPTSNGDTTYYIDTVEDVEDLENTYYVFKSETIKNRVKGQQDGVYYLTCIRGDIRPYPTGSGIGENFRNFKFSQPVSRVYPQNYKNDPLWFQITDNVTNSNNPSRDITIQDPPASSSAADNYVHGYVTISDSRESVTKEAVVDLTKDSGSGLNIFAGNTAITAQEGGASAGSESRKISITGNSDFPTQKRLYVELRRPSIARSGNHTFEYLGFGPGNYSTGFPARQQVVLTENQDFYAQAKKEDAGIVLYTGLNSSGDLYIGNRKINAITGEEKLLDAPILDEENEEVSLVGSLVTTFDDPVTFNNTVLFLKTPVPGEPSITFRTPIEIDTESTDSIEQILPPALTILNRSISTTHPNSDPKNNGFGNIVLTNNIISFGVWKINTRGSQSYSIRTATDNILPANTGGMLDFPSINQPTSLTRFTSNQVNLFGSAKWSSVTPPKSGDLLFKGEKVGYTGSLGWILANDFTEVSLGTISGSTVVNNQIASITTYSGESIIKVTWATGVTNSTVGVSNTSAFRFTGFDSIKQSLNTGSNGNWSMPSSVNISVASGGTGVAQTRDDASTGFARGASGYIYLQIAQDQTSGETLSAFSILGAGGKVYLSSEIWKETGVIGAESIRTETSQWGNFKVGINTLARAAHSAVENDFTSVETTPRANLDIVGTTFISGKTIRDYLSSGGGGKPDQRGTLKISTPEDNAFLVGGDSATPNSAATLRVSTTNNGRVGINTSVGDIINPSNNLDRSFVVVGDSRITSNLELGLDLSVNGGDINTSSNTFNFVNNNANVLNIAGSGQILSIANNTTTSQSINLGNNSASQVVLIGNSATNTTLRIHRNSTNAVVDIASVSDSVSNQCEITLGGAWSNTASFTKIETRQTKIAGEVEIGTKYAPGTSQSRIFTQTRIVNLFDGDQTNTVNFATNATSLTMGSTGGSSTIRNTLNVLASANVNGNIKLNGGLNAGIITIQRARFGTTATSHIVGSVANSNIDFYQYLSTGRLLDTQGTSQWGNTQFLIAGGQIAGIDTITNTGGPNRLPGFYPFLTVSGGTGEGATFTVIVNNDKSIDIDINSPGSGYTDNDVLTITNSQLGGGAGGGNLTFLVNGVNAAGSNYFIPITTPSPLDFKIGDLLLLDRGNSSSPDVVGNGLGGQITNLRNEAYSEIVRVVGLANLSNPSDPLGYRLEVIRGQEGTSVRTDHPDGCVIAKLSKQSSASYITGSDVNADGIIDTPITGIGASTANVNIGVAEFGGVLTTSDYLRLSGSEIVKIAATVSTDIQSLIITDGGSPAATTFKVESTTGNTSIFGNLSVGSGFNKFTVASSSGNTNIAGTLSVENTLTINGSTLPSTQYFTITNGGSDTVPLRTTFQIDTATGDVRMNGGNINIYGTNGTTPRLTFNNSSGDFTTYGSFSALGTGPSTFGGDLVVAGDATINGGDLTVNSSGSEIFKVSNNGSVKIAGISNYFTRTGGGKWVYTADSTIVGLANYNYFINSTGNTLFKLPANPLIGDMIRIIDIGGALTYNLSLVVRAPDNVRVQTSSANTARTMLSGIPINDFIGYDGGELVVQTPYAAFALVYAGSSTPDGNPGVPFSIAGWFLIEV